MKLLFDIEDVEDFCWRAGQMGLAVAPIHEADGYLFSNAKNPSGNSIQVSGRAFRHES
ncbi:hypothetical protein [Paracoccus xiamenensis]|uniref:hypothetical protein n=1 Tax=Paracoccus xiamenensis TaxID=2714901 RepID=UPI00140A8D23|nr:hypothetical protein [Paracoccus xiamenensis]NHF72560.1 hypothetical protein [Paracoccus xiamenensis]